MLKLKTPRVPFFASTPKLPASKAIFPPVNKAGQTGAPLFPPAKDPLQKGDSGATPDDSNQNPDDLQPLYPSTGNGAYVDPKLALFNSNVEAMRRNLAAAGATPKKPGNTQTRNPPVFLKPAAQAKLKDLLLLADGGEEGASSGDYHYDAKTGKIGVLSDKKAVVPGVPARSADVVDILSDMPSDFNFVGWDDKTARQQQSELQKAGLNPQEQMTLLNSGVPLETLAMIVDINRNKRDYGLSASDAKKITEELLQISNARVGAKNHALPLGANPTAIKVFLTILDERESELISSFKNKKDAVIIPPPTDNAKKVNRIPLQKGEYIDDNTVDLTEDLYKFMRESAILMKTLQGTARKRNANFLEEFKRLVKTDGPLDIKKQEPWMFHDGLTYLFNGEVMRRDDPGNIAFGYYGAAVYGKDFLHLGAGLYQLKSDIEHNNPIQWNGRFFDDPQDYDMIEYGYRLYMEEHPD